MSGVWLFTLTVAGGLFAFLFFCGLVILLLDARRTKNRGSHLEELRGHPSKLQPLHKRQAAIAQQVIQPAPVFSTVAPVESVIAAESAIAAESVVVAETAIAAESVVAAETAIAAESAVVVEPAESAEETIPAISFELQAPVLGVAKQAQPSDPVFLEETASGDSIFSEHSPSSSATPLRAAPDSLLYLVPEFDLFEVSRVLQLWQFEELKSGLRTNQLNGWKGSDGTQIELYAPDKTGCPYLELRGTMAVELASYLPQDLPVIPNPSEMQEISSSSLDGLSLPDDDAFLPSPVRAAETNEHMIFPEQFSLGEQILYLDPDFDLSEVKRILQIWQILPEDENALPKNQLGRWKGDDGTLVELYSASSDNFPYLELRGPMAGDLAEFLPQDLPIRT